MSQQMMKKKPTANDDDDYIDVDDEEEEEEEDGDEILETEDISPEKLQEFLNNKSIQRIFQGFDKDLCIKRGKTKYEVDDESEEEDEDQSESSEGDDKSCYSHSSDSSYNNQEQNEEGIPIEKAACVMQPPKKLLEEDKVAKDVKQH